jgi:hypothetical protein
VRLTTTTGAKTGIHIPSPTALKLWGENFSNSKLVAPTGFEPEFQRRVNALHELHKLPILYSNGERACDAPREFLFGSSGTPGMLE